MTNPNRITSYAALVLAEEFELAVHYTLSTSTGSSPRTAPPSTDTIEALRLGLKLSENLSAAEVPFPHDIYVEADDLLKALDAPEGVSVSVSYLAGQERYRIAVCKTLSSIIALDSDVSQLPARLRALFATIKRTGWADVQGEQEG